MGADTSRELFTAEIPASLRCIYPFLSDAQKNVQHAQKAGSLQTSLSFKRMGVACINHGFKLLNYMNTDLDQDAASCLETFRVVRVKLCHDVSIPSSGLPDYHGPLKINGYQSHEIIIAEADEVLALAEEQYNEGFKFDAMLNYHSACIYYRIMESMIPSVTSSVHQKLLYASWRSIKLSDLSCNYVSEYFDGVSCADHYEIHGTNKLGKGSYGSVYLATHRITGDETAVKVMNVDKVTSYYLRKLHTEVSILKEIDHPNIIKLKDVYFGKRSVYLVTDLCRGGELLELLNSGKSQGFVFREDRASKLMRDMVSAVHYLHSKGIVHRDLKLENFLFETKSATSPLVLIDFGLSKHVEKSERLSQRVGSCYYIAPEVLNGGYDYRCDIWSLGVLCFMLLSGSPPFFGKTVEDVYEATLKQEVVFPDKKFRHVSVSCMDFMRRLLVKDPNLRMSTEAALAHPFISGSSMAQYSGTSSMGGISALLSNVTTLNPLEVASSAMGISAFGIVNSLDKAQADEIIASFSIFILAHPLCKLVYQMIARNLSRDDALKFRSEFLFIDETNYGLILLKDFQNTFVNGTLVESEAVSMSTIYNIIAVERSHGHCDGLNYSEYVAAAMLGRVNIDYNRMLVVFHKLDYNDEGFINVAKLRKVLGEDLSESVLMSMTRIDMGTSDGNVSLDQFITLINQSLGKSVQRDESKDEFKEGKMDMSVMNRATGETCRHLVDYMINDAKIVNTNKVNVQRLLSLLQMSGTYSLLGWNGRIDFSKYKKDQNINPFIIPIAKSNTNDRIIGFMRWPTQKEDMELQIVSTNQVGLCLESLNTVDYCYKMVIEMDTETHPAATEAIDIYNKDNNEKMYNNKDYMMFLEKFKGRFPIETAVDKRLALDRFLLNKFNNFPDVYQRLANNLFLKGNSTSALITCELGVDKFYGYGHPSSFHADILSRIPGDEKGAAHAARSAMRMPVWTCASTQSQLESTVNLAGYSSVQKLGEMHFVRSSDPREKDISEKGLSPAQISLDQAAHLMDAVALGHVNGGWNSIIEPLAKKYHDGGHVEVAAFITTQLC